MEQITLSLLKLKRECVQKIIFGYFKLKYCVQRIFGYFLQIVQKWKK